MLSDKQLPPVISCIDHDKREVTLLFTRIILQDDEELTRLQHYKRVPFSELSVLTEELGEDADLEVEYLTKLNARMHAKGESKDVSN